MIVDTTPIIAKLFMIISIAYYWERICTKLRTIGEPFTSSTTLLTIPVFQHASYLHGNRKSYDQSNVSWEINVLYRVLLPSMLILEVINDSEHRIDGVARRVVCGDIVLHGNFGGLTRERPHLRLRRCWSSGNSLLLKPPYIVAAGFIGAQQRMVLLMQQWYRCTLDPCGRGPPADRIFTADYGGNIPTVSIAGRLHWWPTFLAHQLQ